VATSSAGAARAQDDERLHGISIMVRPRDGRRLSNETAVQAGRLTVEVMTWMVPAGNVRFERARAASLTERRRTDDRLSG
jgi:hypothetical protein